MADENNLWLWVGFVVSDACERNFAVPKGRFVVFVASDTGERNFALPKVRKMVFMEMLPSPPKARDVGLGSWT